MPFIQLPGDSTGKLVETVTPALSSAGSTMHREVMAIGAHASTEIATVTSTGGVLVAISNPSTSVTVTNISTAVTVTNTIRSLSSGTVTLSSNPTVISASSGAIQIIPVSSGQVLSFAYVSSSSGNSNLVKGTPGAFHGFYAFNSTAAPRYLKIYNTTSAPTLGSTTGWLGTFGIPASTGGTGGAGGAHPLPYSIQASNGIAFTIVSGIETTSTGVIGNNDIALTLYYI